MHPFARGLSDAPAEGRGMNSSIDLASVGHLDDEQDELTRFDGEQDPVVPHSPTPDVVISHEALGQRQWILGGKDALGEESTNPARHLRVQRSHLLRRPRREAKLPGHVGQWMSVIDRLDSPDDRKSSRASLARK